MRSTSPTLLDRGYQVAYRCAYRLARAYWALRHPQTHGALVAVWHAGRILLVRNSYVAYYSLPGGYVRARESGSEAAVRELREEVGLVCPPGELTRVLDVTHDWEGKRDHVEIFALDVREPPDVRVDHREVVDARFAAPQEALQLELFPPLRQHIEQRLAASR